MCFFLSPACYPNADLRYLFFFGNRLLKTKQHAHTHTHARSRTLQTSGTISILAFIIQSYGSVLSPFSVNSDVSHGSSRGDGSGVEGERKPEATSVFARPPSTPSSSPPHILAGSGTSTDERGNLSRAMTSVVGSACLRTEGGVGPQLISHVFGLLKARTAGDQGYEMNEEDRWLATDEGTEWVIKTVDSILEVVAPVSSEPGQKGAKAKL